MIRMQSWKPQERKDMVVLIDTNVIIDFLVAREPFYESLGRNKKIWFNISNNNIIEARSINSVPQLFYPDYLSVVK